MSEQRITRLKNWLRNRITLEYLGTWEQIYNSEFKVVEFDHFNEAEKISNRIGEDNAEET